jgi:hypothetical protein
MGKRQPLFLARALLLLGGVLWGGWYFGMDWIGWGEPGSARYARYELYNRIAPAVFLVLIVATQKAHRVLRNRYSRWGGAGCHLASAGLAVMALGSALEFWLFTESSYGAGSLRGLGWGTYCIGLLLFYIGTAIFGAVLRRLPGLHVAGLLFMLWLPAGALLGGVNVLLGIRLSMFSVAVALCGAGYVLLGLRLPHALRAPATESVVVQRPSSGVRR